MMHMQFKEIIKRNPLIRRLGKKVNILRAYYHDVKDLMAIITRVQKFRMSFLTR